MIMAIIASIIVWQIDNLVDLSRESRSLAVAAFALGVINLAFGMYLASFQSILFSRKKFVLNSLTINILAIGNSVIPIVFLSFDFQILAFPLATTISTFISAIIVLSRINGKGFENININPFLLISIASLKAEHVSSLVRYTTSFQILKITSQLRTHALVVMINILLGPAANAKFALCSRLPGVAMQFAAKIFQPFYPYIGESEYSSNRAKTRVLITGLTMISIRISLFFLMLFMFLNENFIELWIGGAQYIGDAENALLIFNAAVLVAFFNLGNLLYVTGNFKSIVPLSIFEIILAILIGYLLFPYYGLAGILGGFTVASSIYFLLLANHAFKSINLSPIDVAKKAMWYAIPPNIVTLIVLLFSHFFIVVNNWVILIILVAASLFSQFLTREAWVLFKYRKQGVKVIFFNALPFLFLNDLDRNDPVRSKQNK